MKKLLIVLVLFGAAYWGLYTANDNFTVSNITLNKWPIFQKAPQNTVEDLKKAQKILEQPFIYLGKGRQSFVFESKDQKYILKFIKCQRINLTTFYETMPLFSSVDKKRKANIYERQDRLNRLFTSMSLAQDPLADQTGVLLLHILPISEVKKTVILKDKLGFKHSVDIDTVPFVLQQKADKVMPLIKKCLKDKNITELNRRLDQLIDMFVQRAHKGIIDPDSRLLLNNNIGFLDDRAIYIDIGTFKVSKKSASAEYLKKDFLKLTPLVKWLKSRNKELACDFQNRINLAVETYNKK